MVKRYRQSGLVYTHTTNVALNYRRIPRTEVAYTSYLTSSLDIFIGKTLVPSSNVLFTYPSTDKKPYYSGSLSLSRSIDLTSISL